MLSKSNDYWIYTTNLESRLATGHFYHKNYGNSVQYELSYQTCDAKQAVD